MDTRRRDDHLTYRILRALRANESWLGSDVIAYATLDGAVHVYGLVPGYPEREQLNRLVGQIAGVAQVFSHIDIRRDRHERGNAKC